MPAQHAPEGTPDSVLLAGCGDLGSAVGLLLHELGTDVTGIRRRPEASQLPFPVIGMDLSAPRNAILPATDAVVVALTADESSAEGYEQAYRETLKGLAAALPHRQMHVILVSSTSVLGDQEGRTVTEETPPQPQRDTAKVLYAAEQDARHLFPRVTVLRPAGIYGPGRTRLIKQVRAGKPADHGRITNRIHRDDLAALIVRLLQQDSPVPLLHAVDYEPVPLGQVLAYLAAEIGVAPPPDSGSGKPHGKILDAGRMHKLMGSGGLRYPSFREGYAALLASEAAD